MFGFCDLANSSRHIVSRRSLNRQRLTASKSEYVDEAEEIVADMGERIPPLNNCHRPPVRSKFAKGELGGCHNGRA